jgi:EAL domain-containing protein (putative c-di-GMP-specific phosphodiesterase class I)
VGTCVNCECTSTPAVGVQLATADLRMLVSSPAGQLATVLTDVAAGLGLLVDQLAPGLWELRGDQLPAAVSALREATSTVEAAQIRVVLHEGDADDRGLVAAAMAAPTLDQLDAQARGSQLRELFADERSAFRSAYQPIVELPSQRTVAFEALLRARTAEGAELAPAPLFDQAQRAGWSPRLDRIGRTTALHGAAGWLGDRSLFVNFIPTSIYDPKVCLQTTERAAHRAGIPLEQVVFEVTESERVTDVAHLERIFDYYRERGCRVALDDLGAGYSSLELLVRLRPDVVKLDRTLIENLPEATSTAVVRAVIEITHTYGGLVLAEGVETVTQSDAVNDLGVDLGQGWLYGRPAFPEARAAA